MRIAFIPGDGAGKDVTAEALKILERAIAVDDLPVEWTVFEWGADKFLREGVTLPPDALTILREKYDAIFLGALGDPRVPDNRHAAEILLGLRFGLDLYVNLRPVRLLDARLCPLKSRTEAEVDFVILRENTEGPYVSVGGNFKRGTAAEVAITEDINTRKGVERILIYAFEYAGARGLKRLCMSDKSNAMPQGHGLWQRTFREICERYPEIDARHLYADTLAMEMIRDPAQFQVIVTPNLLGDILSDLGSALVGGLGISPSADLHPGKMSMFEPVHGSAPDIAGRNLANPLAAIFTLAMLLEHVGLAPPARRLEEVVSRAIHEGKTTPDLGGSLGTREVGDWICANYR
jgi:3-isopropylmalate dehydrogenase